MIIIESFNLYNGDSLEILKGLPDNSVDSIVTDPPYELGFMGKSWDSTGIAYNVNLWKECLRVLKYGGHLLAFGGTRTYHRMTCAIEDAGFEIRDQMQWIYGSGFPKSTDISKQLDKKVGKERNESEKWNGWGTALKPANEPICLARKPLSEKTICENVIKWGTGGIDIDDCRIPYDETDKNPATNPLYRVQNGYKIKSGNDNNGTSFKIKSEPMDMNVSPLGRFPANVIFDEEAAQQLDEQSGVLKSGSNCTRTKTGSFLEHGGLGKAGDIQKTYGDEGGASRFFYCAKASSSERNKGFDNKENIHPTVKPIKLMEYLVKLVTPPDGTCLDVFMGSGTTGIACKNLHINFIGIEKEEPYYNIADKRIGTA